MSLEIYFETMGFANAGFIHDSWDPSLKPDDYDPIALWKTITGLEQYNTRFNKASNIHNPVFRYLQRVMDCTIWGIKEVGPTRTGELFMLWVMLNKNPMNTCYYLFDHLASFARKKPDDKGEILVGGIISFIPWKFSVGEESGLNKIAGNNKLDIDIPHHYVLYKALWPAPKLHL